MNKEGFVGPVNIGNPGEFTIKELAEMVVRLTGSSGKIVYKNIPADDPKQRKPDISLAKKELDWQPDIKLEEGLQKTIEYFKKTL
jgi:UDP-glucuronate decarboxylase